MRQKNKKHRMGCMIAASEKQPLIVLKDERTASQEKPHNCGTARLT